MSDIRRGVRLAIDWGKARIGIAACDPQLILCYPVETIPTANQPLVRLKTLCDEYEPIELILGMPLDLRGNRGIAAETMEQIADSIASAIPIPLRVVDERMSTASATKKLALANRSSRQRRAIIDQAAAVDILEQALETERRTKNPPGQLWQVKGEKDE